MQTFLPYADFERSARILDRKRLGKQRVETIQVVRALTRPGYGWANHPAVLMWKGFEEALGRYGFTCCQVWIELGFGDTCALTICTDLRAAGVNTVRTQPELAAAGALPPWLDDEALHRSHRSALVRKDQQHYRPLFPASPTTCRTCGRSGPRRSLRRNNVKPRTKRDDRNGHSSGRGSRPNDCGASAAVPQRRPGRHVDRTPPDRHALGQTLRMTDDTLLPRSPGQRWWLTPTQAG